MVHLRGLSTVAARLFDEIGDSKGPIQLAANAPENFPDLAGFRKTARTLFLPIDPLITTVTRAGPLQ